MAENLNLGNEIKNGFDALAGGVKEAGKRRIEELVEKQGYVAYKNLDAVNAFKNNPEYKDWKCESIDGEFRFYPPNKENELDIVNKYNELKNDKSISTIISIKCVDNTTNYCEYELITLNKRTGEKNIVLNGRVNLYGKFGTLILPSLYYQLSEKMPVIDYEKESSINFTSVDGNHSIMIGNLTPEQMEFVRNIKNKIEDEYHLNVNELTR